MLQYYLGTITIGMILIIIAIVLILLDKKNAVDYASKLEKEKNELTRVLSDSEQMLDELNKFSDYVINQVDKRSSKLIDMLNKFDNKIQEVDNRPTANERTEKLSVAVDMSSESAIHKKEELKEASGESTNKKHKEVLEMVEKGMSDTEIAKALNMGKGEVQLILGMNIHRLKTFK